MITITHGDWQDAPKPAAADHLICAIGDVHGRADLLEALLEALAKDTSGPGVERVTCVFLGDLIDRGPAVRDTLGLAAGGLAMFCRQEVSVEDVLILGNHDAWLRAALDDTLHAEDLHVWQANGGTETWHDFAGAGADRPDRIVDALRQNVPEIVVDAVARMVPMHRIDDWVFVHAGLDPRRPIEDQPEEVVTWIRDAFLEPEDGWPFDVVVVHGHTPEEPFEEPTVRRHRINLDTGAFFTGVLSAIQIRNDRMRFVQAKG